MRTKYTNKDLTDEAILVLVPEDQAELDGSDTSNEDIKIQEPFDPMQIRVDTKNTQMDALIKRLRNNEIDLSPEFQRRAGIWSDKAQSLLIESMLIRIPLPAFYMDASNDDNWLVVDGLQRLTAIRRFVVHQELKLTGLEFLSNYEGLKYDELPRGLRRRIDETDIVIYQIQPGTPIRVKFDIFRRINTGGLPLSLQEIRHALNQGSVTKLLKELAESKEFGSATNFGVSSKRMDDRECVLRFIAFAENPPELYKEDNFDAFLNEVMAKVNGYPETRLLNLDKRFRRAMLAAKDIFGNYAFRKQYRANSGRLPINKAIFESWSVNLDYCSDSEIQHLVKNKSNLLELFIKKMNDPDFDKAVSQGTGSTQRVRLRFSTIKSIINEVLQ